MSPTPKQSIAPMKIQEAKDLGKGLRAAGYSNSISKNPKMVTESKGFKEAAKPIIEKLEHLRNLAIKRAEKTIDKAGYGDAMRSTDVYTKQIELLSGRATDRNEQVIPILDNIDPKLEK